MNIAKVAAVQQFKNTTKDGRKLGLLGGGLALRNSQSVSPLYPMSQRRQASFYSYDSRVLVGSQPQSILCHTNLTQFLPTSLIDPTFSLSRTRIVIIIIIIITIITVIIIMEACIQSHP